jgi:hypothetical protein
MSVRTGEIVNKPKRAATFLGMVLLIVIFASSSAWTQPPAPPLKTRNVVLIVSDGLRWQEISAEPTPHSRTASTAASGRPGRTQAQVLARRCGRAAALFPFLWNTIAKQDKSRQSDQRSIARVTNGMAFSYPGYNDADRAS